MIRPDGEKRTQGLEKLAWEQSSEDPDQDPGYRKGFYNVGWIYLPEAGVEAKNRANRFNKNRHCEIRFVPTKFITVVDK